MAVEIRRKPDELDRVAGSTVLSKTSSSFRIK
jgi:hypothetical protein